MASSTTEKEQPMENGSSVPTMTMEEARAFIEQVPWRSVQMRPEGPLNKPPDPHQYIIVGWREVPRDAALRFANLIKEEGYRGTYTAPYRPVEMKNWYLQIGEWVYWWIGPKMINRERADQRKHKPLEEQARLL